MTALLGISYRTAPVKVREKYAFSNSDLDDLLQLSKQNPLLEGFAAISTCNRTELYCRFSENYKPEGCQALFKMVKAIKHFEPSDAEYFYYKADNEVTEHLMHVTAGLDSMVLGEDQIIGQIKAGWNLARQAGTIDPVLDRLFQKAVEAGKKVRSKTEINSGSGSVSSAAIDLSIRILGGLKNKRAMFIGAGETGELAVQSLVKKGGKAPVVSNRTYSKARTLAQKYMGKPVKYEDKEKFYADADIIIIATGARKPVITKKEAEESLKKRNYKKQVFIDLSVPRNISSEVADIKSAKLFSVDDLQAVVDSTNEKRQRAASDAKAIIAKVANDYNNWVSNKKLSPTIQKIIKNFKTVNQKELDGFQKINSQCECMEVSKYGEHIANKYTRLLIKNLKNVTDNGKRTEYIKMLNELFELQ